MRKILGDLPSILYKFYNFDSKGYLSLVRDSNIYFSSPAAFNDPFEFPIARINVPESIRQECINSLFNMFIDRNISLHFLDKYKPFSSLNMFLKLINLKYNNDDSEIIKCESEGIIKDYINATIGLFSLSGNYKNILMWSHYAAEHSGLCVGFETERLLNINADYIGPVQYQEQLPKVESSPFEMDTFIVNAAFHKAKDWHYEQEFRILKMEAKQRLVHIDMKAIHSIFIGCRAYWKANHLVELRKSLLPYTKFYRAIPSNTHFGMDFNEL